MHGIRARLLGRLDAIAASVAAREGTLALIGLGSVGAELDRLDEYSDLDFFVIAGQVQVQPLIDNLDWLEVAPIAFAFKNTVDGWKVLFEDGVYGEFAVFDPDRLRSIPFDGPRVIWQREGVDLADTLRPTSTPPPAPPSPEWLLGEILTNLYVGLTRLKRGEALSAQRLIQVHAVDRLLELWPSIEPPSQASRDPFEGARRAEQRFLTIAPHLARFIQGYGRTPDSALAILELLQGRFTVNPALVRLISKLARELMA